MARKRKPGAAAEKIVEMIKKGDAANAADAVRKDSSLEPGLAFLKEAVEDVSSVGTGGERPRTVTRGSGPAMLER